MAELEVGQPAPPLRLPAGQGGEIGLDDYRGRRHVVVWFTKGMGCVFCRTQMSQLARGYSALTAANAEVLQVTPTKPERARFYAQHFPIPFPYLCDPDFEAHRAWGLGVRSHSLGWYAKTLYAASKAPKPPPADIGDPKSTLRELPSILADTDMGVFILDRDGVVRYKHTGAYATAHGVRGIPRVEEIVQELARCDRPAATTPSATRSPGTRSGA